MCEGLVSWPAGNVIRGEEKKTAFKGNYIIELNCDGSGECNCNKDEVKRSPYFVELGFLNKSSYPQLHGIEYYIQEWLGEIPVFKNEGYTRAKLDEIYRQVFAHLDQFVNSMACTKWRPPSERNPVPELKMKEQIKGPQQPTGQ